MVQGIYICKICGLKLKENDGGMKCYICSEKEEGLPFAEIRNRVLRAEKWISYGAYAEAKKELSILEKYKIDGNVIQLLYLMMDLKVGKEEELKELEIDFSQNQHYLKILEIQNDFPEEPVVLKVTEYAKQAVENQKEAEKKEENDKFKYNCGWLAVWTGVLVFLYYACQSASYVSVWDEIGKKLCVTWVITAAWLFFRENLPGKIRPFLTVALVLAWLYILYLFGPRDPYAAFNPYGGLY